MTTKDTSGFLAIILEVVNSPLIFSDILITANEPVMVRNASGWTEFQCPHYDNQTIAYIMQTMNANWETGLEEGGFSGTFVADKWRLRITAYLVERGEKQVLAIRRTPLKPLSLAATGLPPQINLMVENQRGLILIAGATGAGKTTTMAALVDQINNTRNVHIETIEDPIEYIFARNKAIFSQREVGSDTPSFYEGVRGAMRQRPDVIVIGEIRDRQTAETAMFAGESGHLVIATLHASSAYGAIQKLTAFFPGEESARIATLAASLMGVIYQSVLPGLDKISTVIATELMFNHNQQFSAILGDPMKVQGILDASQDKVSCSLAQSLSSLVKTNRISKTEAMRSVAGQGNVYRRLQELLS
jgi:twitching motility protein PilT